MTVWQSFLSSSGLAFAVVAWCKRPYISRLRLLPKHHLGTTSEFRPYLSVTSTFQTKDQQVPEDFCSAKNQRVPGEKPGLMPVKLGYIVVSQQKMFQDSEVEAEAAYLQ